MSPAILRTGITKDSAIMVPEQWGTATAAAVAAGAIRLSRAEILSRFAQSQPVEDLRLIGEVEGNSELEIFGRIASLDLRLTVKNPDGRERYRLRAAAGWIYGIFLKERFWEISVLIDGAWTPLEALS